ncbi:MAG: PspC domain-containing protein [Saprospiraceae bacterium]|nr:PspC domain-containing protein [Saprospiraceae bacterium]
MNKIQHINIGGYPFSVNEDAYLKLDQYLSRLDIHFSRSEGCKEIMEDIESRIAELFKDYLNGGSIVSIEHVNQMIQIMGTPENLETHTESEEAFKQPEHTYYTGKRLFRDPTDKKISGVCSGIAHYFGVEDPLWIRVAFIFFGIWGFGILLYIILMILVPEPITSADRLAMKGKPINIQNIAHKVEEEIDDLTDRFDELRHKWRRKKKERKSRF